MVFRGEIGGDFWPGQPQRIEVRGQMPADAIGADQHHRADRIVGGAADGVRVGTRGLGSRFGRRRDLFDYRLGGIKPKVELVELGERPIGPRPAGPLSFSRLRAFMT